MANWSQRLAEAQEMYQDRTADLEEAEGNLSNILDEITRLRKKKDLEELSHRKQVEGLTAELRHATAEFAKAEASLQHFEKQQASLEENYQSLFRKATSVKEREAAALQKEEHQQRDLEARIAAVAAQEEKCLREIMVAQTEAKTIEDDIRAHGLDPHGLLSVSDLHAQAAAYEGLLKKYQAEALVWAQSLAQSTQQRADVVSECDRLRLEKRRVATNTHDTCKAITLP